MKYLTNIAVNQNLFRKIAIAVVDKECNLVSFNKNFFSLISGVSFENINSLQYVFSNESLNNLFDVFSKTGWNFCEMELITKTGESIKSYIFPLYNFEKRSHYYVINLIPNSVSKSLQKDLSVNNDLDSSNFMLMGLAHEIKNPLTGIKVLAEMIECGNDERGEVKKTLTKITKYVDRINKMLDIFFSYVKSEKNKRELVNLQSIFEDIKLFSSNRLIKSGIDFKIEVENHFFVICNRNHLLNLVLNLIKNAEESVLSSQKNERKISVRVYKVSEPPNAFDIKCIENLDFNLRVCDVVGIVIECEDNGIGMDEYEKTHIFTPFFTTKDTGVGLGMSMVKKYVSENCGDIFFESEKGEGAVFTVVLPGIVKDF